MRQGKSDPKVQFDHPGRYLRTSDHLFLGTDHSKSYVVGSEIERHALTFAGTGAGKGACQIFTNIAVWPENLIVIDPKGETVVETARIREHEFGQKVVLIDPFDYVTGADEYRAKFNPLSMVQTSDDLFNIADGMVVRQAGVSEPHWIETAVHLLAALIGYVIAAPDHIIGIEDKNLATVRKLTYDLNDPISRELLIDQMSQIDEFNGYISGTAKRVSRATNEVASYVSTLMTQTTWLVSEPICDALSRSDFDMRDLKEGKITIFLVLPPKHLKDKANFLRLFIQCALLVMFEKVRDQQMGQRCLFILDEFANLGRLDKAQEAFALTRSFGMHLWPFLQDLGQLTRLYGNDGMQSFFGGADAISYFGLTDPQTLGFLSEQIGRDRETGRPIMTPDEVQRYVAPPYGRWFDDLFVRYHHPKVAKRMICFMRRGDVLSLIPYPWFSVPDWPGDTKYTTKDIQMREEAKTRAEMTRNVFDRARYLFRSWQKDTRYFFLFSAFLAMAYAVVTFENNDYATAALLGAGALIWCSLVRLELSLD